MGADASASTHTHTTEMILIDDCPLFMMASILSFDRRRHGRRGAQNRAVFALDAPPGRRPAEPRRPERPAALDHLPPALGQRRHAELQPPRLRPAVPRRTRTGSVFFPQPEPRKIGGPPHGAARHTGGFRKPDDDRWGA